MTAVGDALLLSVAQVHGIETGSAKAFYNDRFYSRAKASYIALLTTQRTPAELVPCPVVEPDDAPFRLTLVEKEGA